MDTIRSAVNLVTRNCFFASVDLKDAFYSILINSKYRKYLKFMWKGKTYQFTSLVQGLAISPRIFTKITKVFFSTLRKQGHPNVNYIDDSLLQGDSEKMVVKLTSEKVAKICINCEKLLKTPSIVIRELAEII